MGDPELLRVYDLPPVPPPEDGGRREGLDGALQRGLVAHGLGHARGGHGDGGGELNREPDGAGLAGADAVAGSAHVAT